MTTRVWGGRGAITVASSLSGWAAFAGPLAFYIATLTPGVAFWDIGEMQTVPYLLGIPHPTGFPLFVIANWCFSHLFAFGEPAWRISLFCALASAGSAWLLWRLVLDVTRSRATALGAALVFATGSIVWVRAVRAEVHDIALFCVALAIVAAWRAGTTRDARALVLAASACGLGLATHPVALFSMPCVAVLAWPALRGLPLRAWAQTIGAGLAPLTLYAYFPLRSAFVEAHGLDPNVDLGFTGSALFDDGAPSTPARFWSYVSGSAFHPAGAFGAALSPAGLAHIGAYWGKVLTGEFSFALMAFAVYGFVVLAIRRRRMAAAFLLLFVANAVFAANYTIEVDSQRYALPVLWATVCCAAFGVHAAYTTIVRERALAVSGLCFATLLFTLVPTAAQALNDVRSRTAYNDASGLGPAIAERTIDGSLLIATWNFATPLLYDRYVAGTLGSRRILCGWPPRYLLQMPSWQRRFHHVYFVVSAVYDVSNIAQRKYTFGRWQLAEWR